MSRDERTLRAENERLRGQVARQEEIILRLLREKQTLLAELRGEVDR